MRSVFFRFWIYGFLVFVCGCNRNAPSPVLLRIDDSNAVSDSYPAFVLNAPAVKKYASTHVVEEDETLFDVAYKHNVDPMNLARINGIKPPYRVKKGRVLQLPSNDFTPDNTSFEGEPVILSDYTLTASGNENLEQKGNEIPEFNEELKKKSRSVFQNDEFSERFKKVMTSNLSKDTAGAYEKVGSSLDDNIPGKAIKSPRGTSFNEQAVVLSSPRIIGSPLKKKTGTGNQQTSSATAEERQSSLDKKPAKTTAVTESVERSKSVVTKKLQVPVAGPIISNFGDNNDGINIEAKLGSDVRAAASGRVIYVGSNLEKDFGNLVIVQHDNGLITSYAHLEDICVKKDAVVDANTKIGTVGKTGDVSKPQLYFEVMENRKPVDPRKYMK
ncbi:MAG: LysM peptidoglycan-binding domain-containing M23 family metallopeptidase [Holosporaceae bacterium]|jgi:murein DD-endopeptidase MepM/ murein hydrolase activator NlpD|nr:LysM peptidoglycan-binding domain-containing M23 family metallopeptidase [Holosporaceae bacterium]